ncbi:MAG: Clp protease N-terminal domain-containing protein [Micropruina sp.]
MNIKQKTGLAIGAAVIGIGGALGVGYAVAGTSSGQAQAQAGQGTNSSAPEGGGPGGQAPGGQDGSRGMGNLAASLAEKLGLDEDTVTQALQEVMQANRPDSQGGGEGQGGGTPPSAGGQQGGGGQGGQQGGGGGQDRSSQDATLAKALAEKLGVDESKVAAALAEIRTEQQANRPNNDGNAAPSPQPSATA